MKSTSYRIGLAAVFAMIPTLASAGTMVFCPEGQWKGARVDIQQAEQGTNVDNNGIFLKRLTIHITDTAVGSKVVMTHGEELSVAEIQYGNDYHGYIVLNWIPVQIVENVAVNFRDGRVLYTIYKDFLGSFSADTFGMSCKVVEY